MTEEKWFYPPQGWPVHELNPEWYRRFRLTNLGQYEKGCRMAAEEDGELLKENVLCSEINQAGVSSKRCCSTELAPPEDKEKVDIHEVVRFVRGLGKPMYPEMWGIEILMLEVDKEPGWAAFLYLEARTERKSPTWSPLWQGPDGWGPTNHHYIYVGSENEKRRLLAWFQAFSQRHGFHTWDEFPLMEQHLGFKEYKWTTREGEPLSIEYPDMITSKDVRTGDTVTVQVNPRFDEYQEFCREQRLQGAFTFNEEPVLMELEADEKWRPRVEAYRSYGRGRYQDDVARDFGVHQSTVSGWLSQVRGEISRRMGAAYEVYLEGRHSIRPDVKKVTRDGSTGKPDLVVELKDGSYEVISVKCFKSDRSTVTVQLKEFQPELNEAYKLTQLGKPVRLLVDYLNLETGQHEVKELSLDTPPRRLNFRKSGS